MNIQYGSNQAAVSRMKGVFVPSTSADHQFYINADKEIRFKFNPNGSDPAGAVSKIAFEKKEMDRMLDQNNTDSIDSKCRKFLVLNFYSKRGILPT